MDALASALDKRKQNSEVVKAFGYRLKNQYALNKAYRRMKEIEWLEDLRQYKGLYDPDVKIEPNNSKVYPKITRSKVNIVLSRLHEMLFPENDRNWEILPTPDPKIARSTVKNIATSLVKLDPQTGEQAPPTIQELQLAIKQYCKETCQNMSDVIDDQLTEMNYSEETKKVLRSGLMFGTGIMKGPMINSRSKRLWSQDEDGEFIEDDEKKEEMPYFEFIRIWDWYPDMTVTDLDKSEGSFERHVMTKHDLRKLIERPDFYGDLISEYLTSHPSGDYVAENWEVDLQVIEVEAGIGKDNKTTTSTSVTSAATDDTNRSTNRQIGKKYEVLEFWGYVDGSDLEPCGIDIQDVNLEYAANVWLLGGVPIKVVLFPGALDRYKVFYYEKDETSIYGEGLARVMRHSQISIAAGARMVLDNGAVVSGPQIEVNVSLLSPGTDYNSIYPRKIWFREGRGIEAQYPAVRNIDIASHIDELIRIIDVFKQFGDEETTLPTWMIGQMVNNETAQATSGRMATITISIKDVVKNFDAFTEKNIRDLYAWNMEFNPREDIKGDFGVKARGVSSLVMKEIRSQALNQLATTMSPEDWDYVNRKDFLQERFRANDISITLRSDEEVDKIRAERENSKAMQLAYQMQGAEIAYKKSQTMAMLTKAKEKNVAANKEAETPPEIPVGADPRLADMEIAKKQLEIDELRSGADLRIRKAEEELAQMRQKSADDREKEGVKLAVDVQKAKHDMNLKQKTVEHGMKVKEKSAMAKSKVKPAGMKPKSVK